MHILINYQIPQELILNRIKRLYNFSRPLKSIGEEILISTRARFDQQIDPEGQPWKRNSAATIIAYAKEKAGRRFYTKKSKVSKLGRRLLAKKKILIWDGYLKGLLYYQNNNNSLKIGSNLVYSRVHQFGTATIPKRAFLGITAADKVKIIDIITNYLT